MNKSYVYLKDNIKNDMSLDEMIEVFKQMCLIPIDEDMVLFETGTYNFNGDKSFYFSLIRQFPNDEEEFYQIHLDIKYFPNNQNSLFDECEWFEDYKIEELDEYIKNSESYHWAVKNEIKKIEVYIDET